MAIIYKVTIDPAGKENRFHISWHQVETDGVETFEQSLEIKPGEMQRLWRKSQYRLDIGRELFRFLDGDARHFKRALEDADRQGESLQVHLRTCKQIVDWPFELLAQEDSFLLPYRLHLVRNVSDWGKDKEMNPQDRPLKLLFMASSPLDIEPELDFEREEEAIFRITEKLAIDMEVEDSGSLEGLKNKLIHEEYDVVHLSGHADIDKNGCPFFIMEDDTGYPQEVSAEELWEEALIENPPRLLFLSGCRTGEASDTGAAASFARMLVENYKVPAVLGWGRSVIDEQATHAEEILYKELSRGQSILDGVQRARYELVTKYESSPNPAWPLLRLFSSGMPLDAFVKKNQQWRPQPRPMVHTYLANSRVKVLKEGFVGRRRQLQQSLRVLEQESGKVGILLLGTSGLGKSCLAGKICDRFSDHTLVIVHGKLNATTLETALKDAFIMAQDKKGQQVLSQKTGMTDKLADLCTTSFKEKNYLLILDDFEQNLEGADKGDPGPLLLEAADLLKSLLHYLPFSGKMTQLVITCRYVFSLTEQNQDLVKQRLENIWLTSFQESEQRKKALALKNIFCYPDRSMVPRLLSAGYGNPYLMEWLDLMVGRMKTGEIQQLLEVVKEKFIQKNLVREPLQRGGKNLAFFLQCLSIYRRPVQEEGIMQVAQEAKIENWKDLLEEEMSLSLIEYEQARKVFQLTPLLREEFLSQLKDAPSCHRAAFAYYKKVCEAAETFDPILVEEWIFHALGCGEEKIASQQGGHLVKHLHDHLTYPESRRVGLWILTEKKQELSNEHDSFLLNELASTLKTLGDYRGAIKYYEQALAIDRTVYGEENLNVARDLNNLGSTWRALGEPGKAVEYCEKALAIVKSGDFESKHPDFVGIVLDNLGSAWGGKGDYDKAIEYYEQALAILNKVFGDKNPSVATTLNNLGSAWNNKGNHQEAARYFKQALSIDLSVHGKVHPDVATDLNNLGAACYDQSDYLKAIEYYEEALGIWKILYPEGHRNIGITLFNLGTSFFALVQKEQKGQKKEKAKKCFEEAYLILTKFLGPGDPAVEEVAAWIAKV